MPAPDVRVESDRKGMSLVVELWHTSNGVDSNLLEIMYKARLCEGVCKNNIMIYSWWMGKCPLKASATWSKD